VLRYTTLVPSLGLRIGPACGACLSAGMRREHVLPHRRKKKRKKKEAYYRFGCVYTGKGGHGNCYSEILCRTPVEALTMFQNFNVRQKRLFKLKVHD